APRARPGRSPAVRPALSGWVPSHLSYDEAAFRKASEVARGTVRTWPSVSEAIPLHACEEWENGFFAVAQNDKRKNRRPVELSFSGKRRTRPCQSPFRRHISPK